MILLIYISRVSRSRLYFELVNIKFLFSSTNITKALMLRKQKQNHLTINCMIMLTFDSTFKAL